jgi:hypothetical protein
MFQVMSDLHLDYNAKPKGCRFLSYLDALFKSGILSVTADVLLLAGDLHAKKLKETLGFFSKKWRLIIFVPGNHEYYGQKIRFLHDKFRRIQVEFPNVKILNNQIYLDPISKIRFAGATLWFPFNQETSSNQNLMNDFVCIKESYQLYKMNEISKNFFKKEVFEKCGADVVISHHAPTNLSIQSFYREDKCNCYYVDPILDNPFVDFGDVKLWIHGHLHSIQDYVHPSGIRVISNCGGYNWNIIGFNSGKVFELP